MIDFANVRNIVIPEGEVFSIARGAEILWRKQKYKVELEYLESTGTQWIDTGLRLNQDSKLELLISHFDTNGNRRTFGSRTSATQNNFSVVSGPVGGTMSIVTDFDNYQNNRLAYVIGGDETLEISISKEKLKINDLEKAISKYGNFTTPANAYLFECSGTYPAGYVGAVMRLYYCRIYDNNKLARDFIPVLDWNDRACLYDKVSGELFYNQGTGEFVAGREIHPVEYLESNGTQYIVSDVQFLGDNYTIKCKFDNSQTGNNTTPIGYQYTGSGNQIMVIGFSNADSTGSLFWNGIIPTAHANRVIKNAFVRGLNEITIKANNGTVTYQVNDSQEVSYETYTSFEPQTEKMWIFGNNRAAQSGGHQEATMKFYYLKVSQNDELLYDYIPAHDENGVGFVFDRVTHTIFDNAGTGEFLYA